ncbi:nucleotide disphospho-sugar-binding domain-containing protein [Leptolyngbya sp. FACHB-711]|uniref:glycosyltransferase n=1 Tax=unclassified Leptolyngbya TaxID=2650499 RepID=UPI001687D19C|nr:nucleotide disphospho-sugar-binding domain-containing protein [Leptolyngbya sp. FACHB-711]MBD1850360.1 glycosyltransferase [Cyanobacteria bacterium FACHB-502]MBD2024090.1 glycosyltransferase [Leptolyngbya sp. FACHB-711]
MTHFGIICPPLSGHLNPHAALGRELQARGHQVTMLQIPDLELKVRSEGLQFAPIGSRYQPGMLAKTIQQLATLSGIPALEQSVTFCAEIATILCEDAPAAIAAAGIEFLIVDQLEIVGETIAEAMGLPFVCVSCGQLIHRRAEMPPFFMGWSYNLAAWAKLRNQLAYWIFDRQSQPILQTINRYREQWQLPPYRQLYASRARLAHLCQQPVAFDFPCPDLPPHVHYLGPFRNPSPRAVPFPFHRLTGQPLIFASLGSIQNTKQEIFRQIAAACAELDVQLVIAHGGGMSETAIAELFGEPMRSTSPDKVIVVEYAPQFDVIAQASLTITHGGLNTVLDSLSHGVPIVAIPITFEQPGTGARIRWTGVGEVMPVDYSLRGSAPHQLDVPMLKATIQQVLTEPVYRQNARRIQQAIEQAGGVRRAADIIEQVIGRNRKAIAVSAV